MSYYHHKKESEKTLTNQDEIIGTEEKQPEFDVHGTALNDIHSYLES